MSEYKDDGGPAFPQSKWDHTGRSVTPLTGGMSLRDYFAAKAMVGLMFDTNGEDRMTTPIAQAPPEKIAQYSYQMADAMLEAREQ